MRGLPKRADTERYASIRLRIASRSCHVPGTVGDVMDIDLAVFRQESGMSVPSADVEAMRYRTSTPATAIAIAIESEKKATQQHCH